MLPDTTSPPPLPGVPFNRRLLVGISGGIDSTALLHALVAGGRRRKLTLLHLNHTLRGSASTADAAFVKRLASRLGLPLMTARADVAALAREQKLSIETAARQARYSFFAKAARQTRCHTLILAHHADDQAETFLFNLLRGGGSGLGARPSRRLIQLCPAGAVPCPAPVAARSARCLPLARQWPMVRDHRT